MDPLEGPGQLFGVGDVVDAVQAAHAGVDGAIEVQLLHALAQENGLDGGNAPVFLRRLGQHLRGLVRADHLVAPQGQLPSEGAGAAGQVQHSPARQRGFGEVLFDVVGPGGVVHVVGQAVVAAGQKVVAAHSCSAFSRGMILYPPAP